MLAIFLDVSFGKSKINQEYFVGCFVVPNTEVVRFDIAMDEISVMNVFNTGDHLVDEHEHSLQGKLPKCLIKQGFQ